MFTTEMLALLPGLAVVDPDGATLGKVVDVYEAAESPSGSFLAVSTGLLGRPALVPLSGAVLDGRTIVSPFPRSVVESAPRPDVDEELSIEDELALHEHYRIGDVPAEPAASRPQRRVSVTVVVTVDGVPAGEVRDLSPDDVADAANAALDEVIDDLADASSDEPLDGASAANRAVVVDEGR